jgi:hypothetical protein
MSQTAVFHQFEIRFVPIVDFDILSKKIIAPYLSRTCSIKIDKENTFQQRITIGFDNDSYSIILLWDRILFITASNIETLTTSNSVIEEPFFSIFSKISKLEQFIAVNNCLFYIVSINLIESYKPENFKKNFQKDSLVGILDFNDSAITLDKIRGDDLVNLTFGPYIGLEDLEKRGIKYSVEKQSELSVSGGILADLRILKSVKEINFKSYCAIFNESNAILKNIWQQI